MRKHLAVMVFVLFVAGRAYAGAYTDSAHGSETYGVDRTSTSQYTQGHCGHCHEQHASIAGVEPAPARPFGDPPDEYLLFNTNFTDQSTNFCYECHVDSGGYQVGNIAINRSYSYNFGGHTAAGSYDADIEEAFSHTTTAGSSHYLPSIQSQILGQTLQDADGNTWSLPALTNWVTTPSEKSFQPAMITWLVKSVPFNPILRLSAAVWMCSVSLPTK
jgi:hypothetical protein